LFCPQVAAAGWDNSRSVTGTPPSGGSALEVLPRERGVPERPDRLLLLGFPPRFVFDW
jgi:hypothetical protein